MRPRPDGPAFAAVVPPPHPLLGSETTAGAGFAVPFPVYVIADKVHVSVDRR
jgi:hypothetical protein